MEVYIYTLHTSDLKLLYNLRTSDQRLFQKYIFTCWFIDSINHVWHSDIHIINYNFDWVVSWRTDISIQYKRQSTCRYCINTAFMYEVGKTVYSYMDGEVPH